MTETCTLSVTWRTDVWYNTVMEAFAIPDVRERLHDVVDALVNESIDHVSTHALGEDLIEIQRAADRLQAEFLRRLHRFDRAHGALAEEAGSTTSWVRDHCAVTWKAGAYSVRLARTLGELPATLDSARTGRASLSNVTLIAQLANAVGVEQVAPLEHILVSAAETLEPSAMRTLTQAARLQIDPDGVLDDDNRAHERRWFECEQSYGGAWFLRGQLDAEGGAVVKAAIDALAHGLSPGETRSGSQRRADALVDMSAAQLRCGDHRDVHGQRPHLTVTVSADTLRSGRSDVHAAPAELSGVVPIHAGAAPPATLHGAGPIHPETARRIACDAVRTVVTVATPADASVWTASTSAVPLSVGRATRTIPAHIRTALHLRDQGCRFPGCDRPPAWTDGHHIVHWSDGGPTELENLVSLCRRHHRAVHEQGWRIHIADGAAVVEPPP